MTEQKRKSTRNFNLHKAESREFDLSKEDKGILPGGKSKSLILSIIIGLIVLALSWHFFFRSNSSGEFQVAKTADSIKKEDISEKNIAAPEQSTNTSNVDLSKPKEADVTKDTTDLIKTSAPAVEFPYKKGEVYKIYQFPFGDGKYSQANPELDILVEVLKKNPELRISISAYTDDIGDAGYNMSLSELRAKAIHDYLVGKGIEAGRMKYQGKGISTKYETKAENRRAEFVIS